MELSIRLGGPADVPTLARLNRVVHGLHVARLPSRFKEVEDEDVGRWFTAMLNTPAVRIFVADVAGRAVGYMMIQIVERKGNVFSYPRKSLVIDQIAVNADRQRQGVGRALIRRALELAQDEGIPDVLLNAWAFNSSAREAFRRCGFEPEQIQFRYIGSDLPTTRT